MSAFTPGPWKFKEYGARGLDGPTEFRIGAEAFLIASTAGYTAEDGANAALIAAALALLEAVETFIRYLDEAIPSHDEVEAKARAAIAQALGEQQS